MYDNYKNDSNNNYNNNNNNNSTNNNNYYNYVIIQVWQIFVTVIVQSYCMKLHVMTLNYLKFITVKLRISRVQRSQFYSLPFWQAAANMF